MTTATTRQPIIVPAGKGPSWWLIMDKMILLADAAWTHGRFTAWESICLPGGGPPPHTHSREDELFYIIEGELTFTLFDQTILGKPGTAVYLPAGSLHTFHNHTDKPTRYFLISTGDSFQAFVSELGFRTEVLPVPVPPDEKEFGRIVRICHERGMELFLDHKPTTVAPEKGPDEVYWVLGSKVTMKLTGDQTQGNFCVVEVTCQMGDAVPPHSHTEKDELFYVLEGQFQFTLNGQSRLLKAGDFAFVPAGVFHSFHNPGPSVSRLLDIHTPGGFEAFFREVGIPAKPGEPVPAIAPPPMEVLSAILAKHQMQMP